MIIKNNIFQIILVVFLIVLVLIPITSNAAEIDDIIKGAEDFVDEGDSVENPVDETILHRASNTIYNFLLGIGMVVAVIVGMVLGIKYMISGSEEKAAVKESLVPYLIACCVIFGAFTIWKIIVNILN